MKILASLCIIYGFIGMSQSGADVLEHYASSSLIVPRYLHRKMTYPKPLDVGVPKPHGKEQNVSQIQRVKDTKQDSKMHQQLPMQPSNRSPANLVPGLRSKGTSNSRFTADKSEIAGNDRNRLRLKKSEKFGVVSDNEIEANRKKSLKRDERDRSPYEIREKSKIKPNHDVLFHKNRRKDKYKMKKEDKYNPRFETSSEIIPPNHKPRYSTESGTASKYSHIKTPSRYMEPPKSTLQMPNQFYKIIKRKPELHSDEDRLKKKKLQGKPENACVKDCEDEKLLKNHRPTHDREHEPLDKSKSESTLGSSAENTRDGKKNRKNPLILSQDGERIEFHIQGHQGPQTYLFGYDTGHGKNRHFRLEERLRDASVRGHYGYYDANGKLQMVEYKARPNEGYEEKHHDSRKYTPEEDTKQSIT